MSERSWLCVAAVACCLIVSGRGAAADRPKADLNPLLGEVTKLVRKHYPKARVTLADQTISFAFNTRKFMIHEPLLTGEWQDACEQVGPQKGGICGDIELRAGTYEGQAVAPQAFDKHYFTVLLLAPYSKKLNSHLYVHLNYPRGVPQEFVKDFRALMDDFEKQFAAKDK